MRCGSCGAEVPSNALFCPGCGAGLSVACGACASPNAPGSRYCKRCGQPLAAAERSASEPRADSAERRQLTVMFCDLVGSTALAGRLDPEELREQVRAYQTVSAAAIARFGGHIAQYLGDGLLVYFGYPAAHEDDAQRAVRAGLAVVEAIGARNTGEVRLDVRVGIHTGLVVVGEMGAGDRREQLALGETPNIAARLEALAEPNTVVISAATHRLVERAFACRDLGVRSLRGVAKPQLTYQVLSERQARADDLARPAPTRLVGREREVALVMERWEAAAEGAGQVVLLSGEAGIGKTRVTEAVCEYLAGVVHARIEGRCSQYREHSPMHVVIELLQQALGFERDDTAETSPRRIERTLAECGLPLAEGIPLLASLMSLPTTEQYPALGWTPQRQKQRTIEIVLEILRMLALRRPLLVLVEDLHWVDASTLELLSLLVDQLATAPIFALFTARPDFEPPWPARSHTTQVTLTRLPKRETEQLVLNVGGGKVLPAEVLQKVVLGADGVPLFVEELTKMILESGLVREREDRYELAGKVALLGIPVTLQDSLMARLDRLGGAKPLAQLAATLGREFSYELLRAVSSADETSLQRELSRLVEAELLYQRGLPPKAQYSFKHALIQETAYQSLLRSTRQQYHRRIADVLAERFPRSGELQPEQMAHHLSEAGRAAEAIPFWQQAGESAVRRSANAEATAHFERALALVPKLPDTPERTRLELALLMALGPVLFGSRGFSAPETEHVYKRAEELCALLGDTPEVFPALWGRWGYFNMLGDLRRSLEIGEQLLALARRSGDPALRLEAHHALWATRSFSGELVAALGDFDEGSALYDPDRHHALTFTYGGHDAGVCALMLGSLIRWVLGSPQLALERGRQALELARRLNHPFSTASAHAWVGLLYRLHGDFHGARARTEAVRALSTEYGLSWSGFGSVVLGSTRAALGEIEAGLDEMRRGLAEWRATRSEALVPIFLALIAEAELARGGIEAGLTLIDDALARIEVYGERFWEAELHRLHGELQLKGPLRDSTGAEQSFERAIQVARRQQAKAWELRAAMSLARLWQGQGRRESARRLVAETTAGFAEGSDTADLRAASDLLARLA